MSQNRQVKIVWDASVNAYRMTSPWIKELKEFMGTQIPHSDRAWDADQRTWTFTEKHLDNITKLLKLVGAQPTTLTRQQVEAAAQQNAQQQASQAAAAARLAIEPVVMQFVRTVPFDAMKRAYLSAAMSLHPDRGGDATKMTALNESWQRIAKEIYGQ